jgi:ATP-binding cassette, subfamily B, bacterial
MAAFFRPHWKSASLVVLGIAFGAAARLVPALFQREIVDHALPTRSFPLVAACVVGIVAAAIGNAIVGVWQGNENSAMGQRITRDIRATVFAHLQSLPISFFVSARLGTLANRAVSDLDRVAEIVSRVFVGFASYTISTIFIVIAMVVLDWRLAVYSLVFVPLTAAAVVASRRRITSGSRSTLEKRDEFATVVQETLSVSGIMLIKAFGTEAFERARFAKVNAELRALELRLAVLRSIFGACVDGVLALAPALLWLGGVWLLFHEHSTLGTIIAFIGYFAALQRSAASLAEGRTQLSGAVAVFTRIFEYLDLPAEECGDGEGLEAEGEVIGVVSFENVHFSYGEDRAVLKGVTFHVEPGQVAAFVGPSGAGKTTMMQLLLRFYECSSGVISVDGIDVKQIAPRRLRRHIGIVTQETFLFHETICENLRYAREDASDEEVRQAARAANIHDRIAAMPLGYSTVVGERGVKMSGGERQRIAIARMLLKDPQILIFDEATSELDSHSDSLVQAAVARLMKGRTTLVIAHRLSTLRRADVTFLVEQGRIADFGRHDELLARNESYSRLFHAQMSSFTKGVIVEPVSHDARYV